MSKYVAQAVGWIAHIARTCATEVVWVPRWLAITETYASDWDPTERACPTLWVVEQQAERWFPAVTISGVLFTNAL
jgi:hypothetical protein